RARRGARCPIPRRVSTRPRHHGGGRSAMTDSKPPAPTRVLLADDHPPTRAGVRYTLEQAGMVICAEAGDADGAVEAALREKPDLCLIDVHMPGSGIQATKAITDALPDTSVIMLTVSRDDSDLFDALRAGASG